jgi:hypothetical protein
LQGELEEERWARKQQGEGAELAHKALHDRQALLEQAYQRITAAEAASHQGESKAQVMLQPSSTSSFALRLPLSHDPCLVVLSSTSSHVPLPELMFTDQA